MASLLKAFHKSQNVMIEFPTGTGKTYSMLSAAIGYA